LLGVVCAGLMTAARVSTRDSGPAAELARERVTAEAILVIRDDPRLAAPKPGRPPLWTVEAVLPDGARVLVMATHESWRFLLPSQEVVAKVRYGQPDGGDLTAAILSANEAPLWIGPPPWHQRLAGSLRAGLQDASAPLEDRPGGLLPGLVVGDTSRMSPELEQQFRDTGMSHLTAVSGSNVAIVIGFVVLLARFARLNPRWTAILAAIALAAFVILVRPSPSVLRAAAMGAIGLLALASGRLKAALPALCATITVLVLIDPALAIDPGFALSVSATAGLLLLAPGMRDWFLRRRVRRELAEALAVPLAAQLACAPVIAGLSGSVSLIAVPANFLAVPAIAPATIIGVGTTVIAPIWPAAAEFGAWLASWPAWWLVKIAETGSAAPAAVIPWPGGVAGALLLAALTTAVIVLIRRRSRTAHGHKLRRLTVALALSAAAIIVPLHLIDLTWPPEGWIVIACDVGQGDATFLNAGNDTVVLVDTGPDPTALTRCLRDSGAGEVAMLVLSHFHADHTGGMNAVRARETLGPALPGLPVTHQATAETLWTVGELTLRVLHTGLLTGTRSDPNNNSVVILATIHGTTILLLGDAETEQQQALRERYPALRADILKVAHHGSSYQDSQFLAQLHPRVALISAGAGNRYGHPSPTIIAALQRSGATVARTDQDGDLALAVTPTGLHLTRRNH
jgi:competence protein ComEC